MGEMECPNCRGAGGGWEKDGSGREYEVTCRDCGGAGVVPTWEEEE